METAMSCEELLKELECPVCYTYISPPVRQCTKLHAICDYCFSKVDRCPVCRQEKNPRRNHVLERLYSLLEIPCQYEGCEQKARGIKIKAHELTCHHRPCSCPLSILNRCNWTGTQMNLAEHCRSQHSDTVVVGAEASLLAENIRENNVTIKYLTLFYVFDRVFRIYWDINANTGAVKFSVTFQGNSDDSQRFSYRVRFMKRRRSRVVRSLYGKCANVTDILHLTGPGSVVGANYNSIKDFCSVDGDLQFYIKIVDNLKETVCGQVPGSKRTFSSLE